MNTCAPSDVPAWISATFTFVIALATILYVVYTRSLWNETKKSADAAKTAAEAAKTSADIAAAMYGPIIQVAKLGFARSPATLINSNLLVNSSFDLQITFKNYGSVSALADLDIKAGLRSRQGNRMIKEGFELAAGSECPISISVRIQPEDLTQIQKGEIYSVNITCTYATLDGQKRHKYETERVLSRHDYSFTAETNRTTPLNT
ncbi:MAG TPA: hypothetical protein VGR81_00445 [Candidatus Acidoferrales bacterium]|nr:hypothetical protein [Candidatus Acidoferrales bacterium]